MSSISELRRLVERMLRATAFCAVALTAGTACESDSPTAATDLVRLSVNGSVTWSDGTGGVPCEVSAFDYRGSLIETSCASGFYSIQWAARCREGETIGGPSVYPSPPEGCFRNYQHSGTILCRTDHQRFDVTIDRCPTP